MSEQLGAVTKSRIDGTNRQKQGGHTVNNGIYFAAAIGIIWLEPEAGSGPGGSDEEAQPLSGQTIVITGSLEAFENRSLLKRWIEDRGGRVADSVTSKTTRLINNQPQSESSKNKKARALGIPIVSEAEFLAEVQRAEDR